MLEKKNTPLYRVLFSQNEQCYEVYARYLSDENLMGFVEIWDLVFHETRSGLLVDPSEEKLRTEFRGVKRCYIPMHAVLRIDELSEEENAVARVLPFEKPASKREREK